MGVLYDFIKDINKKKSKHQEGTNVYSDNNFLETRRNFLNEISDLKLLDDEEKNLRIEAIKISYSEIINDSKVLLKELYFNNWQVLDFVEEKNKESLIRNFSKMALDINEHFGIGSNDYVNIKKECVNHFPNVLLEDKEFIKEYIILYPNIVEKLPFELKNDKEFLIDLGLKNQEVFSYLDENLLNNEDFLLSIIDVRLGEYFEKGEYLVPYELEESFENLLLENEEFCKEIFDRGLIEYYPSMGEDIKDNIENMEIVIDCLKDFEKAKFFDLRNLDSEELSNILKEINILDIRKEVYANANENYYENAMTI